MARYRTIKREFWQSPSIERMPPHEKLLYIYLFTNPHAENGLGVTKVSKGLIAFQTGLEVAEVEAAMAHLAAVGKITIDNETGEVLVNNFIKHQCTTSPKLMEGIRADFQRLEAPTIAKALSTIYPSYFDTVSNGMDRVSKGSDTIPIPPP